VCTFDSSLAIDELGNNCGVTRNWVYPIWNCAQDVGVTALDNNLELGATASLFGQP
jgi:hypothetical protein